SAERTRDGFERGHVRHPRRIYYAAAERRTIDSTSRERADPADGDPAPGPERSATSERGAHAPGRLRTIAFPYAQFLRGGSTIVACRPHHGAHRTGWPARRDGHGTRVALIVSRTHAAATRRRDHDIQTRRATMTQRRFTRAALVAAFVAVAAAAATIAAPALA